MPEEIILLTGEVEGPHFRTMLNSINPSLTVIHAQTCGELEAACLSPAPKGGRRLIAFSTSVIVPKAILNGLSLESYNFHSGPPTYPGSHPASFAIYEGAKYFGVTAHLMEEKVDCGSIVAVEWLEIQKNARFMELEIKAYELLLNIFANLAAHFAISNDPLPVIDAHWSGLKRTEAEFVSMKRLEADMDEAEIRLRFRAFG
jgi:methionyl-tRNA formyltransferase